MAKENDKEKQRSLAKREQGDAEVYKTPSQKREVVVMQRRAPLPTPEEMQGYENVKKGFAERIMVRMEKNSDHNQIKEIRNQIFSFTVVLLVIGLIAYSLFLGTHWLFSMPVTLALIVGLYTDMIKSKKD